MFDGLSKVMKTSDEAWTIEVPLSEICGDEEKCAPDQVVVVVDAKENAKCIFTSTGGATDIVHKQLQTETREEVLLLPQHDGNPFVSETFTGCKEFRFSGKFGVFDTTVFICSSNAAVRIQVFKGKRMIGSETAGLVLTQMEEEDKDLKMALGRKRKQHRKE